MCGPVECLPCQSDFFVKLKSNRLLQLWTLLWLPLAFLWLLHLGFQLDNLIWAAGDKSFQVRCERFVPRATDKEQLV